MLGLASDPSAFTCMENALAPFVVSRDLYSKRLLLWSESFLGRKPKGLAELLLKMFIHVFCGESAGITFPAHSCEWLGWGAVHRTHEKMALNCDSLWYDEI